MLLLLALIKSFLEYYITIVKYKEPIKASRLKLLIIFHQTNLQLVRKDCPTSTKSCYPNLSIKHIDFKTARNQDSNLHQFCVI